MKCTSNLSKTLLFCLITSTNAKENVLGLLGGSVSYASALGWGHGPGVLGSWGPGMEPHIVMLSAQWGACFSLSLCLPLPLLVHALYLSIKE